LDLFSFYFGKTKDGMTCISQSDDLRVFVLMHTEDDDGVERWVLNRVVHLGRELAWIL